MNIELGKGGLYKVYKLKTKTGNIIAFLGEQKKESRRIMANIEKLRENIEVVKKEVII